MKKYREQDTGYNPSSINNFFGLSWGKRESRKQPGAALITLIFILLLFFILSIGILNLVFSRRVTQDKLYYKFCANRLAENGAQIAIYELHKNYYGFNRSTPFFAYKQGDALGKIPKKYLTEDKFTDKEFGFYNIYVDGEIKFTIKADDPDYTKYSLSLSGKNELLDVTYKAENLDFNNCTGDLIITSTANLDNGRYRSVCTVKYKLTNLLDFSLYGSNGIMDGQGYSTTNIDSAKSKIYFNEPMLINGTPTDLQINADKIYINGNIGSDLMNGGDLDNNGFMFYFLQSLWIRSKVSFLNSEGKMIKLPSFMRYNPEAPEDKRVVIPKFENTNTSFNDWKGIDVVDDFEGLVNFVSTRKPNEFNTSSYNEPTVDKNDPQSKLKPYARQIRMDYKDGNNMPLANVNTNATGNIEFNTSNSNDALAFKTFLENNGLYDSKKNEYKIEDASRGVNPKDFQLPTNDTLKNIYSNNANSGDKFLEVDEKSITINGKKYDSSTGVSVKKIFNPSYYNPDGPLQSYVNPIAQWENDNYPKDPGYGYNFKGKDRNCVEIDLSKYTISVYYLFGSSFKNNKR